MKKDITVTVYDSYHQEWLKAPLTGWHGTFHNPVVMIGKDEVAAHAGFYNPDTHKLIDRCQSMGCGNCFSWVPGCRYEQEKNVVGVWYI
ncbi:MAG: hypothetical protein [Podoviridae sp. ctjc_2]|nr:MAG: hypothetical protein [Podoviridae sp. ctjc_2]